MPLPRYLTLADAAILLGGNQWLAELLEARGELRVIVSGYAQEWTDRVETSVLREYLIKHHGSDLLAEDPQKKVTASIDKGVTYTERNAPPYTTEALEALFQIMRNNWTDYDPERLPKQSAIARQIDEKMGWEPKGDPNKEPSRTGKALARIIKPDSVKDE